jgi:hypothetical protein
VRAKPRRGGEVSVTIAQPSSVDLGKPAQALELKQLARALQLAEVLFETRIL